MKSPRHLSHKPIISANDYDETDGCFSKGTDVRALSVGRAQYDLNEISLKVWRHTKKRWSRQSEELPVHRNLDLSILFLAALLRDETVNRSVSTLREELYEEETDGLKAIKAYYDRNKKEIDCRLQELKSLLDRKLGSA